MLIKFGDISIHCCHMIVQLGYVPVNSCDARPCGDGDMTKDEFLKKLFVNSAVILGPPK